MSLNLLNILITASYFKLRALINCKRRVYSNRLVGPKGQFRTIRYSNIPRKKVIFSCDKICGLDNSKVRLSVSSDSKISADKIYHTKSIND